MGTAMAVPSFPLPEPLRAAEIPSFTHYSVAVRLPEIARRTLAENDFPPETVRRIEELISEIPKGEIRAVQIPEESIDRDWTSYTSPYLGLDWLEIPWFFAVEYFYLRILEATGYFQPGEWRRRDPYAKQKQLGLESTRANIFALAGQVALALSRPKDTYQDSLERLLLADLWGNQNDLSMWPVQKDSNGRTFKGGSAALHSDSKGTELPESEDHLSAARKHLLVDDCQALFKHLSRMESGLERIDFLLDNAGFELVADLALVDFLLTSRLAAQVVLHGKSHPVFVSDALEQDVHNTLDFLTFASHEPTRALAIRLRSYLVEERLNLQFDPFWVSPLAAWEMPASLAAEISQADLLISKGDANYRRLLGDRHWPIDHPFSAVVNYLQPAVLALRTLKSEIAAGIPASQIPSVDPNWMSNGKWGLIQFAPPGIDLNKQGKRGKILRERVADNNPSFDT